MKRSILVLFTLASTFGFMAGCASTPANLQRETARYIGNIKSEQVTVSDIKRGATEVKWTADTPNGKYDCSADDMVRRVHCVKE